MQEVFQKHPMQRTGIWLDRRPSLWQELMYVPHFPQGLPVCAFRHLGRQSAWGATRNATCHDALCLCQCHGQSFQCHTTGCNLAQIWHLGRNGIGKWREVFYTLFEGHIPDFFFGGGEGEMKKKTATCFFSWRWKKIRKKHGHEIWAQKKSWNSYKPSTRSSEGWTPGNTSFV